MERTCRRIYKKVNSETQSILTSKNYFMKSLCKFLVITILSVGLYCTSYAQPECPEELEPIPAMYVLKADALERIVQFSGFPNSKFHLLEGLNKTQDLSLIYTRVAVDKLLRKINVDSGIRIYFARYCKYEKDPLPDEIEDGKVILLFATQPRGNAKPTEYYFLNDKRNDNNIYPIGERDANEWIIDYNINVQKVLRQTLIPGDTNNIDKGDKRFPYDTKSIFYSKADIEEAFKNEVEFQRRYYGIDINAYKVSFSSYTPAGDNNGKYKNRLLLQFDYLYDSNTVLNQEAQEYFWCRASLREKKLIKQFGSKTIDEKTKKLIQPNGIVLTFTAIDNGQLCPTHCP